MAQENQEEEKCSRFLSWMMGCVRVNRQTSTRDTIYQTIGKKDPEEPEYEGYYAAIGGMESVRFERPRISKGAKILNIYATVSGWLEVEGSRHWALIFDGTLYLYNTPTDPIPLRTFILEDNRRITRKNSISVQLNCEKIHMNVLVDDESKINEKISKWNEAIDEATNDCSETQF